MRKSNIIINGYTGTWRVVDQWVYGGIGISLLENEQPGESTGCICVDERKNIIMENVTGGLNEVVTMLDKNLSIEVNYESNNNCWKVKSLDANGKLIGEAAEYHLLSDALKLAHKRKKEGYKAIRVFGRNGELQMVTESFKKQR